MQLQICPRTPLIADTRIAYYWIALILLSLTLGGCSLQPTQPKLSPHRSSAQPEADWPEKWKAIQKIHAWMIMGKIGIRTKEQADSAVINKWQQIEDEYLIELSSAVLGLGKTVLKGNGQELYLTNSDGETLYSQEPQILLQSQTGWELPLSNIPFWIKAIPAPGKPYQIQFDPQGNPQEIKQDGWTISASRFQPFHQLNLPGKIVLSQKGNRITFVIHTWELDEA